MGRWSRPSIGHSSQPQFVSCYVESNYQESHLEGNQWYLVTKVGSGCSIEAVSH